MMVRRLRERCSKNSPVERKQNGAGGRKHILGLKWEDKTGDNEASGAEKTPPTHLQGRNLTLSNKTADDSCEEKRDFH